MTQLTSVNRMNQAFSFKQETDNGKVIIDAKHQIADFGVVRWNTSVFVFPLSVDEWHIRNPPRPDGMCIHLRCFVVSTGSDFTD